MSALVIAAAVLFGLAIAVLLGLMCAGLLIDATKDPGPRQR